MQPFMRVQMEAGSLLYLPAGWWHYVETGVWHGDEDTAEDERGAAGEVNVAVLRIKDTGVFDGIIKAKGVEVDNGAVVKARFRKKKR